MFNAHILIWPKQNTCLSGIQKYRVLLHLLTERMFDKRLSKGHEASPIQFSWNEHYITLRNSVLSDWLPIDNCPCPIRFKYSEGMKNKQEDQLISID